jgi:hypothetical protein
MSLAAATRDAVRSHPFLLEALRAGVVNYAAAARFLDVGEEDAVVAALRRFGEDLAAHEPPTVDARVRMARGFGPGPADDALLTVGDTRLVPDAGSLTVIVATGTVGPTALRHVLGRLAATDTAVEAAGTDSETLVVAVPQREGPTALRTVEAAVQAD